MDGALLKGADLHNADLRHASLTGADFEDANLDGAIVDDVNWIFTSGALVDVNQWNVVEETDVAGNPMYRLRPKNSASHFN